VQYSKLQVIRKSSFTATPWKNGGGIAHEAIRVPVSTDPFRRRVSVTQVDASSALRNEATIVFAIDRQYTLEIIAGKAVTLEPWDSAVLSHCNGRLNRLGSANSSASSFRRAASQWCNCGPCSFADRGKKTEDQDGHNAS
jgi:environmental stress-induced protein Ves